MSGSGNSGDSAGLNQGSEASGDAPDSPCEEMTQQNEALRGQLAGDQENASIRGAFGPNGASTVAHASLNGGSAIGAASRLLPGRYAGLAQGLWENTTPEQRREMRQSGRSNVCPDAPFQYDVAAFRPHQSHCESKILETLFAGTPAGTLVLNINWQYENCPNDPNPCAACKRLLCHAQEHCGIDIMLCQEEPEPEPLECP
jgi:hypothetical protein